MFDIFNFCLKLNKKVNVLDIKRSGYGWRFKFNLILFVYDLIIYVVFNWKIINVL